MTDRNYEVGYGRPPKAYQFQKGQSGNPRGPQRKPIPTWASVIEDVWMEPLTITLKGELLQPTGFEMIVMQLMGKMAEGNRQAFRVLLKYEAFAKTKPRFKTYDSKFAAAKYEAWLNGEEYDPKKLLAEKRPAVKLAPEHRTRKKLDERIARMRAGLEEPNVLPGMTAKEAGEMYEMCLVQPPKRHRPRERPRKGPLVASEIFDRAIHAPVTLKQAGADIGEPRMMLVIRRLLADAVRGSIKAADMLTHMHAVSLKQGDFYPETRYTARS